MQGQFTQPVRVRPQDVSVHRSSHPGGGKGDVTEQLDTKKCPEYIKQAEEMIGKLKVLSSR